MHFMITPEYLKLSAVSARQCSFAGSDQPSAITLMERRTPSSSSFTSP